MFKYTCASHGQRLAAAGLTATLILGGFPAGLDNLSPRAEATASMAEYAPSEVIVKFRKGVSKKAKEAFYTKIGAKHLSALQLIQADVIQVADTKSEPAWVSAIRHSSLVTYADLNYALDIDEKKGTVKTKASKRKASKKKPKKGPTPSPAPTTSPSGQTTTTPPTPPEQVTLPSDTYIKELWGLHNPGTASGSVNDADIDAPQAWAAYVPRRMVVVAVIDTGMDYGHPDLAGSLWWNLGEDADKDGQLTTKDINNIDDDKNGYTDDFRGWNFVSRTNNPYDDHGHGTHVAGTIAARANNAYGIAGVAGQGHTRILPLKFLNANGSGYTSAAIEALSYAVKQKALIANNSWGGGAYNQPLYDAIKQYTASGGLFVASAGNSASNNDAKPSYPASYNLPNVISVASSTSSDTLSSFSNYGASTVHVAAPGSNILSTFPGGRFTYMNGTSMASPHVSGIAALMMSQNPALNGTQARQILITSVRKVNGLAGRVSSSGVVNAQQALQQAGGG
jgi:subtilisin family serine protease